MFLYVKAIFHCYHVTSVYNVFRLRLENWSEQMYTNVRSLHFPKRVFECVCVRAHAFACYCVCTVSKLINHYAQRGSACLCAILCVYVCASDPVYVTFNDLFWWSGVADIVMDGPYALYDPCIFHNSSSKAEQSRYCLYGQDVALGRGLTLWDLI